MLRVCILFVCTALSACRTVVPSASAVKWGFLADDEHHLIRLPNNAIIGVCGQDIDVIAWAINSWGAAIGRHYNVVADCDHEKIDNWSADSDFAKTECSRNGTTTAFARPYANPQLLVDCGQMDGAVGYLHEVGHLFGLCDQYAGGLGNCAYDNGVVDGSIMNAADKKELTQDDIDGIRALAKRNGITTPDPGPNPTSPVTLSGAGTQVRSFSPPAIGRGVSVSFAAGCEGPWTGDIFVNGSKFICDNCDGPQGDVGPWLFGFGKQLSVTKVRADLGDGSCDYHLTVYP